MGLYDVSFHDIVNRNAVSHGARKCWTEVDDGRELTFLEYKKMTETLAYGLSRVGIQKRDRIGIVGKNSLEFFLLYGAAAVLGAVVLPINWRLSAEEMCFNLNDCAPKVLFVDAEFQSMIEGKKKELASVQRCHNLKSDQGAFALFGELLRSSGDLPRTEVCGTDDFVIIHTAAVAGRPRGAVLSHQNLLLSGMHFSYYFGLSFQDINLNLLPLFHVGGLSMVVSAFIAGAACLNISKFEPKATARLIQDRGASFCFEFPPILDSIVKAAKEETIDIRSLKAVVGLGTPEGISAYETFTGGAYYCMYGQTETSCLATMGRFDDRPGSAGKTILMADVQLMDDEDRPVPIGEVGEITVKGPMVFKGYWGLPEDNAYTFRNGRHHTGDLGRFNADGFLFYAGRKAEKELIKPGGENVYPAEVEKVILQHPAISKTVVIGVPDPKWKEGIKAVCELHPGKTLSAEELIRFVGERIASFKKPQYVEFVKELPIAADGSLNRAEVKKRYGGN
jgi:acyl-CoA synthetase (AMP-forming)/AMP-acid ligase II